MISTRNLSRSSLSIGLALALAAGAPAALGGAPAAQEGAQEAPDARIHLAPRPADGHAELRLVGASPGERALLLDLTGQSERLRADGLPLGRVVAARAVDVAGSAAFALPDAAFAARATLGVVVVGAGGARYAGRLALPASPPLQPRISNAQSRRVLVTEFMKDPVAVTDARGEWIELFNPTAVPIDVEGWVLSDDGNESTVLDNAGSGIVVPAYGFAVVGRFADVQLNGGVALAAVYAGFTLGNADDEIILSRPDGTLVDAVRYLDGPIWPDLPGASVSLSPRAWFTHLDDLAVAWCEGSSPMPMGDLGTPGALNDACQ